MSCCGGNCGCGPACKCGTDCGGCKMYPDMSHSETAKTTAQTLVQGVAPQKKENGGCVMGAEEGCPCGPNCQCDPCTCN